MVNPVFADFLFPLPLPTPLPFTLALPTFPTLSTLPTSGQGHTLILSPPGPRWSYLSILTNVV